MCVDVQDLVDEGSVFFVLSDTAVCFMQGGGRYKLPVP